MANNNSNDILESNTKSEITNNEKASKRESSLGRKVSFIRESVSDSGVPDLKLSSTLDATKRSSLRSQDAEMDLPQGKYIHHRNRNKGTSYPGHWLNKFHEKLFLV